jgi:hypothetical protein
VLALGARIDTMSMLYSIGRVLQFAGLILLPVAIAGEVEGSLDLKQMLALSGLGVVVFIAGWLLQQAARQK